MVTVATAGYGAGYPAYGYGGYGGYPTYGYGGPGVYPAYGYGGYGGYPAYGYGGYGYNAATVIAAGTRPRARRSAELPEP